MALYLSGSDRYSDEKAKHIKSNEFDSDIYDFDKKEKKMFY